MKLWHVEQVHQQVAPHVCLIGFAKKGEEITVKLLGGDLKVRWDEDGSVYMTGPAEITFEGEFEDKRIQ